RDEARKTRYSRSTTILDGQKAALAITGRRLRRGEEGKQLSGCCRFLSSVQDRAAIKNGNRKTSHTKQRTAPLGTESVTRIHQCRIRLTGTDSRDGRSRVFYPDSTLSERSVEVEAFQVSACVGSERAIGISQSNTAGPTRKVGRPADGQVPRCKPD